MSIGAQKVIRPGNLRWFWAGFAGYRDHAGCLRHHPQAIHHSRSVEGSLARRTLHFLRRPA